MTQHVMVGYVSPKGCLVRHCNNFYDDSLLRDDADAVALSCVSGGGTCYSQYSHCYHATILLCYAIMLSHFHAVVLSLDRTLIAAEYLALPHYRKLFGDGRVEFPKHLAVPI